ncbi:hypothetical protein CEXT_419131, partial [Caerostris extrusa]
YPISHVYKLDKNISTHTFLWRCVT